MSSNSASGDGGAAGKVLDASQIDEANQQIMARYNIPADHVLNTPSGAPVVEKYLLCDSRWSHCL